MLNNDFWILRSCVFGKITFGGNYVDTQAADRFIDKFPGDFLLIYILVFFLCLTNSRQCDKTKQECYNDITLVIATGFGNQLAHNLSPIFGCFIGMTNHFTFGFSLCFGSE